MPTSNLWQRHAWKIVLTLVLMAWAGYELVPLKNRDFDEFLSTHALASITPAAPAPPPGIAPPPAASQKITFASLLTDARARVKADPKATPSVLVALRQLGHERQLDLSAFFPDIDLGSSLRNIDKRNTLLLGELQRQAKGRVQLGLDLNGGVAVTLELHAKDGNKVPPETLATAIRIIDQRINSLGVTEPLIRAVGDNRIEVQLPGENLNDNPDLIREVIRPAKLEFRLVSDLIAPQMQPPAADSVPPDYEVLVEEDDNGTNPPVYYVIKRRPEMTGEAVAQANVTSNMNGFAVSLRLNAQGAKDFAALTTAIVHKPLAIVLDGKLHSAPVIREPILNGEASISGNFDQRAAFELKSVLNNPLDAELTVLDQTAVGPSLAQDAIESGKTSTAIAVGLVAVFMLVVYTFGGVIALLSLLVNILIIFGVMANLGATLTLPGLAGIVLTIGMAVDANILIFERMREELAAGKTLATSNQSGFTKALTTILDAHLVQLIICAVMIEFGAGPIKGFGVTLAIGVCSTLFSVLITGHLLMELAVESGAVKKFLMRPLLKDVRLDFVRYGKPAIIASGLLVVVGFSYVLSQGNAIFGRDFKGGDEITLAFKQSAPDTARIRDAVKAAGITDLGVTTVSVAGGGREQVKLETAEGKGAAAFAAIEKAFPSAGVEKLGQSQLGKSIGSEILVNALKAVIISMAVILLYIAFRFEFGFGVAAMVSILHDILMTISVFVIFGHQFSAPMVAAILCIAGYSINETVVVFDRIREELKLNPTGKLSDVVNDAIRKVFARTIKTSTTTFLAAFALWAFGGGVLRDIAFTFLVGIVTSTFSAIFVAAQVFYWWHKGDRKHVEAHADATPVYEWTASSKASE